MLVADKEELLYVLDKNGNNTGKMELRSVVHDKGLYHNEVALWIIDKPNRRVLLQRRSPLKRSAPNMLGIVAGHVVGNDTFEETVKSECLEEIGFNIENIELKKFFSIKMDFPNNNHYVHMFYVFASPDISRLKIQQEEVSELVWIDYDKLKEIAKSGSTETVFLWNKEYRAMFALLDKIIYAD